MARATAPAVRITTVRPSQRTLTILLAGAALIVALYFGWGWLRDSTLVEVRDTEITGVHGFRSAEIRERLESRSRGMSTLAIDAAALRRSVEGYPNVRSIAVDAHPPHGLTIAVRLNVPVAALIASGKRVAVTADGELMPGVPSSGLPLIPVRDGIEQSPVSSRATLSLLEALAAAPPALREQVSFAGVATDSGITLQLRDGPALRFGDATRLHAKWAAAAVVLTDPGAARARYIDLTAPERPAAGGLEPVGGQAGWEAVEQAGQAAGAAPATQDVQQNPQLQP